MAEITEALLIEKLKAVKVPLSKQNVVEEGLIRQVEEREGSFVVEVSLAKPDEMVKKSLTYQIEKALQSIDSSLSVAVEFVEKSAEKIPEKVSKMPSPKAMIAVGSGKGGVGKSSVTVNLAMAFQKLGYSVGIMDTDVYGPSIPTMLGVAGSKPYLKEGRILTVDSMGIKVMSADFFLPPGEGVIWRGPMLHKMIQQFVTDVNWDGVDIIFVDLPPGTGDVPMSLSQTIPVTGAVMVSTPQQMSLIDVEKGVNMFKKLKVPLLGVIENMSYFICDSCDKKHELFDHGGVSNFCKHMEVPYLGEVPLDPRIREYSDRGKSFLLKHPESKAGKAFIETARVLEAQIKEAPVKATA